MHAASPGAGAEAGKENLQLFQVKLKTKGEVYLYGFGRAPLLELVSSMEVEAGQKGETTTLSLRLPEFSLKDRHTKNALFDYVARPEGDSAQDIFDLGT